MSVTMNDKLATGIESRLNVRSLIDAMGFIPDYGLRDAGLDSDEFNPLALFASGEQGAWYDPSDFSTMFQDSEGTAPVTAVGQPVGLILDKSKGLALRGEEVDDPTLDTPSAWRFTDLATFYVSDGAARAVNVDTVIQHVYQEDRLEIGRYYEATIVISEVVAGGFVIQLGGQPSPSFRAPGTYKFRGVPTSNGNFNISTSGEPTTGVVTDFSVREISGNHARQFTWASRPALRQGVNGHYYLEFDGVDDFLSTTAIDFTATDKMLIVHGHTILSNIGMIAALGSGDVVGTLMSWSADYSASWRLTDDISQKGNEKTNGYLQGITYVGRNYFSSGALSLPAVNTSSSGFNDMVVTITGFANKSIYLGTREGNDIKLNGRIYSLIIRGALSSPQEITDTETWVADKTGVTLP